MPFPNSDRLPFPYEIAPNDDYKSVFTQQALDTYLMEKKSRVQSTKMPFPKALSDSGRLPFPYEISPNDDYKSVFTQHALDTYLMEKKSRVQSTREPSSVEAGFYSDIETRLGNLSLHARNDRFKSDVAIAPNSFGRDHTSASPGFGAARPFSVESRFHGGGLDSNFRGPSNSFVPSSSGFRNCAGASCNEHDRHF